MACVLLLAGAMFASPGLLAQGEGGTKVGAVGYVGETRLGFSEVRREALAPPEGVGERAGVSGGSVALRRVGEGVAAVRVGERWAEGRGGERARGREGVDYMLCEDGVQAKDALQSCAARTKDGRGCVPPVAPPHVVRLVVPAGAAGINESRGVETDLAEVTCHVVSVAPLGKGREMRLRESVGEGVMWGEKAVVRG